MDTLVKDGVNIIKEKNIDPIGKINGESLDIVKENVLKLKEIFPEVFCENQIDFERLEEVLGNYIDDKEERYRFEWNGKSKAIRIAQTPSRGTLRPCKEESKNWDTTGNLYIEGDNLEVLKLLQKSYQSKVKMIYIDPPYNTGNDFVYKDNYKDNLQNYFEVTGQIDEEGNKTSTNSESDGRYHTNWLNMMYPRLRLARNLLTEDGVICIQIDDNEVMNLNKIADEVFGEENYLTTIVVKMSEATGMKMAHADKRIPKLKEYILIYRKSGVYPIGKVSIPKDKWDSEYKTFFDNITKSEVEMLKSIRDNENRTAEDIIKCDSILAKATYHSIVEEYKKNGINTQEEKDSFNYENAWRIFQTVSMTGGAKTLADEKNNTVKSVFYSITTPEKKMYFIKGDYNTNIEKPRIKILFADDYLTVNPCDFWQDIKTTGLDNEGYVDYKNGKKPLKLIGRLLKLFAFDESIVLDFFAGSATTAQAVIEMNYTEGLKNKFIMVQLPENLDISYQKSDNSGKKDIKKTIEFLDSIGKKHYLTEIGKERIRRACDKMIEKNKDKENLDIGFKVFKLDSSNLKPWNPDYDNIEMTLEDTIDNFIPGRTEEDVVFEIMLKYGVDLTYPIDIKEISNKKVFSIGFGALIICLDNDITLDVVNEIVKLKEELNPATCRVVFKDNGFKTDSVKTNAVEILKRNNIEEIMSI